MDSARRPHRSCRVVIYYVLACYRICVVKNIGWGDLLASTDHAANSADGLNLEGADSLPLGMKESMPSRRETKGPTLF